MGWTRFVNFARRFVLSEGYYFILCGFLCLWVCVYCFSIRHDQDAAKVTPLGIETAAATPERGDLHVAESDVSASGNDVGSRQPPSRVG